jgi:hypothetical protein
MSFTLYLLGYLIFTAGVAWALNEAKALTASPRGDGTWRTV